MKKIFVILSAIMLAIAFAVPAGATDWHFYGSARMQTFNVNQDKNNPHNEDVNHNSLDFDDRDSRWALNHVSRLGAKVHSGDIGGGFEYGHDDHHSDVTLRKLYGTWDFGAGELTIGKTYTPLHFVTNQVFDDDSGLKYFGAFYELQPMIQVKVDGFKLALISPNNGTVDNNVAMAVTDNDNTYPKVEASYTLAMDTFSLKVFGGLNLSEYVTNPDGDKEYEYDVNSNIYGVAGVVNVGPVTLKAMIWGGQNVGLYGLTNNHEVDNTPDYVQAVDDVRDNNSYGGVASVGVKINDMIGVEAGYGYVASEDDVIGKDDNDEAWAVYLQAPITLAQGVTIVPEIGHYDYEDNDANADEGYESYFGAKWQINF